MSIPSLLTTGGREAAFHSCRVLPGEGKGTGFAVNVPLPHGMTDQEYSPIFGAVASALHTAFQPTAVVMQCGADTLERC